MPKFNLDINGVDVGAAEGYEAYGGPLPKTGSYPGKLKICQIVYTSQTAKNPNKPMLKIGVELTDCDPPEAVGFVAFRNIVLIDSVIPFANQFLLALTDGSDAEFEKIKKAFYVNGPVVDESKKNILRIGTWKINSPTGELPVKVSVKQRSYLSNSVPPESKTSCGIESFLLLDTANRSARGGVSDDEPIAEEEIVENQEEIEPVDLDDDESLFDDEEESVSS